MPETTQNDLPEGCTLAAGNDHWLRHVIEGGAVRATAPRLKAQYVTNKLETILDRPWEREISGRLLSLANDIIERARQAADDVASDSIKFRHVCFVSVSAIRTIQECDVIAEPKEDDSAHSNIVVYRTPMAPALDSNAAPKVSQDFIKKICSVFQVCDSDDISKLEACRI